LLRGCDAILHAGDLESPDILASLSAIAPTYAVRGNLHWQFSTGTHDQDLPLSLTLVANGRTIWMTHGHMSFAYSVVDKVMGIGQRRSLDRVNRHLIERLARMKPPEADVVVFGHSHLSCAFEVDGVLYFNPGAVSASAEPKSKEPPSIGFLMLREDGNVGYMWENL
jgi:putative phosphoesterase